MDMQQLPSLTITRADAERLDALLGTYAWGRTGRADIIQFLNHELDRAVIVNSSQITPDVVTMNSKVRFRDEINGTLHEVTLVFPADEDLSSARLSVLSPAGSALLGVRVGQTITFQLAANPCRSLTVLTVNHEPELSSLGDG